MESVDFWVNWFVWRDAMLVSLLSAASLSYLGVWVVVKRVVYVPLALSQVSSVGVVFAYLLGLIKQHNTGGDVAQIFELTPSFVATTESGIGIGNTSFSIRGTDASRINITVDGFPIRSIIKES